ncbi:hypothetical protein ARMA_1447 [Ardenticatena maritima]|uniref:Uncharacterized protein n=1 Tax=Ardenticatena maritima TaxID=872965 RepID=A0A0M9UCJ5_9CHLR|nr:hypothetical protein ARMA_1447 [Ardenticatena maritima]
MLRCVALLATPREQVRSQYRVFATLAERQVVQAQRPHDGAQVE